MGLAQIWIDGKPTISTEAIGSSQPGGLQVGRDYVAEARAERRLGDTAAVELEAKVEAARVLFGDALADSLTRQSDQATGALETACDRFEQAVAQLTVQRDDWERWCEDAERRLQEQTNRADALAIVLRRAVLDAGRWVGKKKGRRVPGFVKAASVLLDGEPEGES